MTDTRDNNATATADDAADLVRTLAHDVQVLVRLREILRTEPLDPRALPIPLSGNVEQRDLLDIPTELSLRRIGVTWAAAVIEGLLKEALRSRMAANDEALANERETLLLRVFFFGDLDFTPRNRRDREEYRNELLRPWSVELGHRRNDLYPEDKSTALGRFLLLRAGKLSQAMLLDMTPRQRRRGAPDSTVVAHAKRLAQKVAALRRARNLVLHSGPARREDRHANDGFAAEDFLSSPGGWTQAMATLTEMLAALAPPAGMRSWDAGKDDAHVDLIMHAATEAAVPEPVFDSRLRFIQAAQLEKVHRFLTHQPAQAHAKTYLTPQRVDAILRSGQELATAFLQTVGHGITELGAAVERVRAIGTRPDRWRAMWTPAMGMGDHLALAEAIKQSTVHPHEDPYLAAVAAIAAARGAPAPDDDLPFWNKRLAEQIALSLAHASTAGRIGLDDEGLADLRAIRAVFGVSSTLRVCTGYLRPIIQLLRDVIPNWCSPECATSSKALASSFEALLTACTAFHCFAAGYTEEEYT